jgi:hypothetical protein
MCPEENLKKMKTNKATCLTVTRPARSSWRYWVLLTAGVGVGGMVVPPPSRLVAQVPVPRLVAHASQDVLDSLPATGLPAHGAAFTTDTGDYAPGHRDFARYTTPLFCVAAARTEVQYARRTAALTAAAYTLQHTAPEQDTLPASVTRVARTCGVHFLDQPVAHMAAADLPALFALALLARQDTLAQAILARSAVLAPTDAARQQVWLDGLETLLHAEPARVAAATALLAQWTRQGQSAVALQLGGATRFLAFWRDHFDPARIRAGAEALLQMEPDPTQSVATKIALVNGHKTAYSALLQLTVVDHPDSLAAVGQRLVQDLQRPVWAVPGEQPINLKWVREFQSARHDAEALRAWAEEDRDAFRNVRVDGQPMFPFKAAYWIAPTGATVRDTVVRPTPGRVSLYEQPEINCYNYYLFEGSGDKNCTPLLDRLTRWQRRYGGQGLQIIVIGYSSWNGALYSGLLAPAAQAERIAWYVHQFAQLPVPVAVQPLGVTRFPAPDGTLHWNDYKDHFDFHINLDANNHWQNGLAVLTDRAGRVVYVGPDDASILDGLVLRLVSMPSAGQASTTPSPAPQGAQATPASAPAPGASLPAASSLGATPVAPVTPGTP